MTQPTKSDLLALIQRARAEDALAANELAALVRAHLKGFFQSRVGPVESSDLAQDSVFNVCRYLHGFEGATEKQFWKWVHVVARNVAAGSIRRGKAQKRDGPVASLPEDSRGCVRVTGNEPTPSASAQRREQLAEVRAALAHLSQQEQLVIRLRYDESKEWPEVARTLGKTEEAARIFYRRTIKKWSELCNEA